MNRPRRRTYLAAIRALGIEDNDGENDGENDIENEDQTSESENELELPVIGPGGDEIERDVEDIEVFSESSSSESSEDSDEEQAAARPAVDVLANPAGIILSRRELPPALRRRNILNQRPRALINIGNELAAFLLFHTMNMVTLILRATNRKVRDINRTIRRPIRQFTENEFLAAIAILLRAGVDRDNLSDINNLWNPVDSRPFYRATMGLDRFKQFLRCVRFDNIYTRAQRQANDRLAAISDIWLLFLGSLRQHYVPEADITVDEQLVGYRGRVPGRTYLPSKPKKYGVKIFWACEARTEFPRKKA